MTKQSLKIAFDKFAKNCVASRENGYIGPTLDETLAYEEIKSFIFDTVIPTVLAEVAPTATNEKDYDGLWGDWKKGFEYGKAHSLDEYQKNIKKKYNINLLTH